MKSSVFKIILNTKSFKMPILHQLYDYKISPVNSHRENTNSKGDFVFKNRFETFFLKISGIQKKYDSDMVRRIQLIRIEG